jgi:hypothetical protein
VNPARAKIEVALTQLRGVGNNRANAKSAADKTVKRIRRGAFIVRNCWIQLSTKPMPKPFLNRLIAKASKSDRMPF